MKFKVIYNNGAFYCIEEAESEEEIWEEWEEDRYGRINAITEIDD